MTFKEWRDKKYPKYRNHWYESNMEEAWDAATENERERAIKIIELAGSRADAIQILKGQL